jgi:uncharacterized membrane protein
MLVCGLIGGLVGAVVASWLRAIPALLIGWDAAAFAYVFWAFLRTHRMTSEATARLAVSDDPGRAGLDVLALAASVASLGAVGVLVLGADTRLTRDLSALLAVMSVVASWALVHTVFTERYTRLYYNDTIGGIDFNNAESPCYVDFMYFAFTVGMTYQVSDTSVSDRVIRATVLRHALLSYLFGAVIIAAVINLVVGLAR